MEIPSSYQSKFKFVKEGVFLNELRNIIAQKTKKPFPQIAKLTQGWSKSMLEEAATLVETHPSEFWNYRKKTLI